MLTIINYIMLNKQVGLISSCMSYYSLPLTVVIKTPRKIVSGNPFQYTVIGGRAADYGVLKGVVQYR